MLFGQKPLVDKHMDIYLVVVSMSSACRCTTPFFVFKGGKTNIGLYGTFSPPIISKTISGLCIRSFKGSSFFLYSRYYSLSCMHFIHLLGKPWISCQKNRISSSENNVQAIFKLFKIAEVFLCKRMPHWSERYSSGGGRLGEHSGCWRVSHQSDFKTSFTKFSACVDSLTCNKITSQCTLDHSSCFSIKSRFKWFILWQSSVQYLFRLASEVHNTQHQSGSTRRKAYYSTTRLGLGNEGAA